MLERKKTAKKNISDTPVGHLFLGRSTLAVLMKKRKRHFERIREKNGSGTLEKEINVRKGDVRSRTRRLRLKKKKLNHL